MFKYAIAIVAAEIILALCVVGCSSPTAPAPTCQTVTRYYYPVTVQTLVPYGYHIVDQGPATVQRECTGSNGTLVSIEHISGPYPPQ